jgi:hypothetical protein
MNEIAQRAERAAAVRIQEIMRQGTTQTDTFPEMKVVQWKLSGKTNSDHLKTAANVLYAQYYDELGGPKPMPPTDFPSLRKYLPIETVPAATESTGRKLNVRVTVALAVGAGVLWYFLR